MLAYEQWMHDARRRAARRHRRVQRGGLPGDARAARLAGATAPGRRCRGPSRVRPRRATRTQDAGERDGAAPAAHRRRGARLAALARRRAARVSPPRGAARRGGGSSTRCEQMTDRGAGRRRGIDRRPRADGRAGRRTRSRSFYTLAFPPQQYKLGAGRHAGGPGHQEGGRHDRRRSTKAPAR